MAGTGRTTVIAGHTRLFEDVEAIEPRSPALSVTQMPEFSSTARYSDSPEGRCTAAPAARFCDRVDRHTSTVPTRSHSGD